MYGEAGPAGSGMPGGGPQQQPGGTNQPNFQEFYNFGGPGGGGFTFRTSNFGSGNSAGGSPMEFDGFGDILSNLFGAGGGMGGMNGFQQQTPRGGNGFSFGGFGQPSGGNSKSKAKQKSKDRKQEESSPSASEPLSLKVEVTLEDLYKGRVKKMKVSDDLISPKTGRKMKFEKVFPVAIEAGMKPGSIITFDADDEFPRKIQFEVVELPHSQFKRSSKNPLDVIWKCNLSKRQIEKGVMVTVPLLDGRSLMIDTKDYNIRTAGSTSIPLEGYGLPASGSKVKTRGKLIVEVSIKDGKK